MKPLPLKKLFIAIWLPLAGGLVLRLLYLWEYTSSPLFLSPSTDALYHQQWAHQITHGQFFPELGQPFFRAPLYPLFLGFLYWIGCNDVVAVIIQAIFSLLTIVLVARIADRFGGSTPAKIAAWITACYGPLLSYQLEFQLPVLTVPLFLLFTEWILSAQTEENKYALPLASLTVGLLAITQANCLVLILPVLYLAVKGLLKARRRLLSALAIFIWMIPIIPVTYANWNHSHQFELIASQGGINFYLGNNEKADGAYAVHPKLGADWQWDDAKHGLRSPENKRLYNERVILDETADSIFWRKGIRFWQTSPTKAMKLYVRKIGYLFHHYEIGNNRDLQRFWAERPVAKWLGSEWIFGLIAPIGIAGFLLLRKKKAIQITAVCGGLLLVSYLPFFITARYRLPVAGILIAFASVILYKLYHHEYTNRQVLLPAVFGIVIVWNPFGAPPVDPSYYPFTKANAYLRLERYEESLPSYREALSYHSSNPMVACNYGIALMWSGDWKDAENWLRIAVQQSRDGSIDDYQSSMNDLEYLLEKEGRYEEAFSLFAFDSVLSRPNEVEHENGYDRVYYRFIEEREGINILYRMMDTAMVHENKELLERVRKLSKTTVNSQINVYESYAQRQDRLITSLASLLQSLIDKDFPTAVNFADSIYVSIPSLSGTEEEYTKRYDRAVFVLSKFGYKVDTTLVDWIHFRSPQMPG